MGAVHGLAKYYRRRPDRLSVEEVQEYLYHLMEERKLAWSSCKRGVERTALLLRGNGCAGRRQR